MEHEVKSLLAWRAEVAELAAVSSASAAPNPPAEEVIVAPPEYEVHPYVKSRYKKYHRVLLGYPNNPSAWITACGWRFGASRDACPVPHLPAYYKDLCENCFPAEREMAKAEAQAAVRRGGGAA